VRTDRTIHAVLLALLLLLSQQMGMAHAVTHWSGKPDSRSEQPIPLDKACDQCLAFAAIGSALTAKGWVAPLPAMAANVFTVTAGEPYFPIILRAFHSRAPPLTV
jgi:hypothetical protein